MKKSEAVYCICRRPDDYKLMLQCTMCEEWFHASCVHIDEESISSMQTFTCPSCASKDAQTQGQDGENPSFVRLDDILPPNPHVIFHHYDKRPRRKRDKSENTNRNRQHPENDNREQSPMCKEKLATKGDPSMPSDTTTMGHTPASPSDESKMADVRKAAVRSLIQCFDYNDHCESVVDVCEKTEASLYRIYPISLNPQKTPSSSLNNLGLNNTPSSYKSKFRTLLFNLKDSRNNELREKLLGGHISPNSLVQMSPEELAPPQTQQERQHMITTTTHGGTLTSISSPSILRKTHKGEIIIESENSIIPTIPPVNHHIFLPNAEQEDPAKEEDFSLCDKDDASSLSPLNSTQPKFSQYMDLFNKETNAQKTLTTIKERALRRRLGLLEGQQVHPLWAGHLILPGVSACSSSAIFHSVLGPPALGPEIGRLAFFNLPSALVVRGRLSQSAAMSYLRQVSKVPTRAIGIAQIVGRYAEQHTNGDGIHTDEDAMPNSPSVVSSSTFEGVDVPTPVHHSIIPMKEHLCEKDRFGVIFSNQPSGMSSYHGWYVKDLYLVPATINKETFTSSLREPPLSMVDLDAIPLDILAHMDVNGKFDIDRDAYLNGCVLLLVFVLARMSTPVQTPRPPPSPSSVQNFTDFQYRPIVANSGNNNDR